MGAPTGRSGRAGHEVTAVLERGTVELRGRLPWSSNATFLTELVGAGPAPVLAIYKPESGERPLWDFPAGLWKREVAAYLVSEALGWALVPPTVARAQAPLGPGSVQLWVEADYEQHYFTLLEDGAHHPALRRVAVFDVLINNADRKGGHLLLDGGGHVWAIDHGVCFHAEPKLRTVVWDFAGEKVDAALLDDLGPISTGELPSGLDRLLEADELAALVTRARRLRRRGRYPAPSTDFPYPWPLV